jgi:hypothetical protein
VLFVGWWPPEGYGGNGLEVGKHLQVIGKRNRKGGKSQVVMNKGLDRKSHKGKVYGMKFVSVKLTPS